DIERTTPKPVVLGRHLLALGLTPGPKVGSILKACYDAQIDGAFSTLEDGIEYAERMIREGTSVA
ncbi:MAG: CCA tRNA nucleotidyltransferase, partial [Nitrospiraceae bacterium]